MNDVSAIYVFTMSRIDESFELSVSTDEHRVKHPISQFILFVLSLACSFRRCLNSFPTGEFFMLYCCLRNFFIINFFEKNIRTTIRVSNSLDPDQAQRFVGPDLGLNCLQMLLADDSLMRKEYLVILLSSIPQN